MDRLTERMEPSTLHVQDLSGGNWSAAGFRAQALELGLSALGDRARSSASRALAPARLYGVGSQRLVQAVPTKPPSVDSPPDCAWTASGGLVA